MHSKCRVPWYGTWQNVMLHNMEHDICLCLLISVGIHVHMYEDRVSHHHLGSWSRGRPLWTWSRCVHATWSCSDGSAAINSFKPYSRTSVSTTCVDSHLRFWSDVSRDYDYVCVCRTTYTAGSYVFLNICCFKQMRERTHIQHHTSTHTRNYWVSIAHAALSS